MKILTMLLMFTLTNLAVASPKNVVGSIYDIFKLASKKVSTSKNIVKNTSIGQQIKLATDNQILIKVGNLVGKTSPKEVIQTELDLGKKLLGLNYTAENFGTITMSIDAESTVFTFHIVNPEGPGYYFLIKDIEGLAKQTAIELNAAKDISMGSSDMVLQGRAGGYQEAQVSIASKNVSAVKDFLIRVKKTADFALKEADSL